MRLKAEFDAQPFLLFSPHDSYTKNSKRSFLLGPGNPKCIFYI